MLAGVGRGDRFWTCAGFAVTTWRVGADDSLAPEPGQEFLLPGSCRSLALSEDGATLWAATGSGLVPVDVSSPTGPVVKPALLASRAFYHLRLNGTWLVAHELRRYGELGSLLVFRVADLVGTADPAPVKSFDPIDGGGLWARPVGFALLEDTLLVEWFRVSGGTARAYRVERHALDAAGVSATLGGLTLRESEELGLLLSPLPVAGRGRRAVMQPWRRVVELEGPGALRFRTGAYHGSLERVWVDDQGDVLALGPFGTHRVDLSEPRQPTLSAGALDLPPDTRRLRLAPARSASGPLELLTLAANRANVQQEDGTAVLSCLRPGAGGLMEPAGVLRVNGGPAALASTRGQLFQVAATLAGPLRLRRFPLPTTCTGGVLGAASERLFALGAASTRKGLGFALDAERAEALLGELHLEGTTFRARLAWGAWEGTGPVATGTLPATTDQFTALALAGGRGLVIENRRQLHVLRRDGDRIVTESSIDLMQQPQPVEVSRLLAFDGQVAWLALASPTFGALALRVDTPGQVLASYETPAPVRSIDFAGERLVLGMNEALTVAAPACEGPPGAGR
jgi:hypothetical protein